jgi:glutaredoxin 3
VNNTYINVRGKGFYMKNITMYTTSYCGFCNAAKKMLTDRGNEFKDIDVSSDDVLRAEASLKAGGYRTVPMIFVGDTFVGGHSDLVAKISSGEWDKLIK